MNLRIDPRHLAMSEPPSSSARETGIYVRAQIETGNWRTVDIAYLERESLIEWLRSRGGKNVWAENVVLTLLGHEQIVEE